MERDAIIDALTGVTKKWAKQRKKEERDSSATLDRKYVMMRAYHVSIRAAAWRIMEEAYLKASADGRLPAHARQIMYAARGPIQRTTDRPIGQGFDQYFTQTLLPEYMDEKGVNWNNCEVWQKRGWCVTRQVTHTTVGELRNTDADQQRGQNRHQREQRHGNLEPPGEKVNLDRVPILPGEQHDARGHQSDGKKAYSIEYFLHS